MGLIVLTYRSLCVLCFSDCRQQRLAEMREKMSRAKFGQVIEISKPDYVREVNEAGQDIWVVLHLYNDKYEGPLCLPGHMRWGGHKAQVCGGNRSV